MFPFVEFVKQLACLVASKIYFSKSSEVAIWPIYRTKMTAIENKVIHTTTSAIFI